MPSPPLAGGGAAALPDGLPIPRRYWAIAAILLAICMSVLDSTIINVALPTIARDFGASSAASIWVVNAYQLAILVALLPLATLGENSLNRQLSIAALNQLGRNYEIVYLAKSFIGLATAAAAGFAIVCWFKPMLAHEGLLVRESSDRLPKVASLTGGIYLGHARNRKVLEELGEAILAEIRRQQAPSSPR